MDHPSGATAPPQAEPRPAPAPAPAPQPESEPLPASAWPALLRLLVVVAAGITVAIVLGAWPVLVVILALVAMIMLHELGHFATAKWSGMKVTEYFLGFGPKLWSIRRGETAYGVKAIPAGGYVRIVGMTMLEEVDPVDEARSYRQATFPRRLLVAVAGSAVHFIIAFVLLFSLYAFSGSADRDGADDLEPHAILEGPDARRSAPGFDRETRSSPSTDTSTRIWTPSSPS